MGIMGNSDALLETLTITSSNRLNHFNLVSKKLLVLFTLHSLCLPHGLGCAGGTCIGGAVDSIGQE